MTRLGFVIVVGLTAALAGCQRQAAPEKVAEGGAVAPAEAAPVPAEAPPPGGALPSRSAALPVPQAAVPEPQAAAPDPQAAASEPQAAAPRPALSSNPPPLPRVLASGTILRLSLQGTIASNTSRVGDRVVAELTEDVTEGGRVLLTAGTEVVGRVTVAKQSGRVKGRARLVAEFDEVRDGGSRYRIDASPVDVTAESSKGQDAKIAGGAAAAGVVIGAIAGGGKGALKGGAIGGAAGGAAVLATRGKEVVLEAGTTLEVTLTSPAQID